MAPHTGSPSLQRFTELQVVVRRTHFDVHYHFPLAYETGAGTFPRPEIRVVAIFKQTGVIHLTLCYTE